MSKEEIIERLEEIAKHAVHVLGEEPFCMSLDDGIAIHEAIDILKSAQPEIIRCRDCEWWDINNRNDMSDERSKHCYDNCLYWEQDDFCSRAERRTDG